MKTKINSDVIKTCEPQTREEVFAEVPLFDQPMNGSAENADCGCFSCDGNPCNK